MKNKMRFLTTKQARRRGIALEMALSVLLITFALSTLIVSIAMLEVDKVDRSTEALQQRTALEQLGQDFCAAVAGNNLTEWATGVAANTENPYRAVTDGAAGDSTVSLMVYTKEQAEAENAVPLLQVELQMKGTNYTVTQWSYR